MTDEDGGRPHGFGERVGSDVVGDLPGDDDWPEYPPRRTQMKTGSSWAVADTPRRHRSWPWLVIGVAVFGLLVLALSVVAMQQLAGRDAEDPWTPVLQNVIQTGYQALAVGVLGGLAKLWLDGRSRRNAAQAELRQRRSDLIRRLVAASHSVDASRLIISANRSVKSWTEQTNLSLIPARTEIKSISHDLANWKSANLPMFSETSAVQARLDEMTNYLTELIEEYSEEKSALSELQRTAGTNDAEREQLLGQIWRRMRTLHHLGDYLLGGDGYGEYRHDYIESLRIMRAELASFDRLVAGMR